MCEQDLGWQACGFVTAQVHTYCCSCRQVLQKNKNCDFSNSEQAYVKGVTLDFPGHGVFSPPVSFKRGWLHGEHVRQRDLRAPKKTGALSGGGTLTSKGLL